MGRLSGIRKARIMAKAYGGRRKKVVFGVAE